MLNELASIEAGDIDWESYTLTNRGKLRSQGEALD